MGGRSLFIASREGNHWIFGMTEGGSVITEGPKGGSINVTCPYRLGGRLSGILKSSFVIFKHLGWLAVGMATDISNSRELTNRRLSHDGAVGSPYSPAPSSCRNLNLRFAVKTTTFMRDRQIFSPFLKFVFIF